jgi:hypothetical protein
MRRFLIYAGPMRLRSAFERETFAERTRIRSVEVSGDIATLLLWDGSSIDQQLHPRITAALAGDHGFTNRWTVLDDGHELAFDATPDLDVYSMICRALIVDVPVTAPDEAAEATRQLLRRSSALLQVLDSEGVAGLIERGDADRAVDDLDAIGAFSASATLRRAVLESSGSSAHPDPDEDPGSPGPWPRCEVEAFRRDVVRSIAIAFER